jgi:hypothetical protein
VQRIVAFRYVPRYPTIGVGMLVRLRRRLERFGRVPPLRAFVAELRAAEAREERGEPGHLPEMILRLARGRYPSVSPAPSSRSGVSARSRA